VKNHFSNFAWFRINSLSLATTNKRNDGLDTLRALAIILVFMYHYMVFVSKTNTFGWGSSLGWIGVDLFFVLSGYLIANQIFSGVVKGQDLSLKAFYARRFLRTLPNFYVVLALYFLFPVVMGGKTPPPLWQFLTFTQNYQLQPGTAFSHAWSLCIEEQFYLFFPLLVLVGVRYIKSIKVGWIFLLILIFAGIVARGMFWSSYGLEANEAGYYPNIYYSTLCRIDEFLPGIAVAMLKNFHSATWQRLMQWGNAILALGVLSAAVMSYGLLNYFYIDGYGYGYFMTTFGYSLLAMCFAVLVVAALSSVSLLYKIRVPGAAKLAAWSYAIYLSHKPLAFMTQKMLTSYGIESTSALLVLIVVALCLLGGWLLYRLVETPFMNLRDWYYPSSFAKIRPLIAVKAII
jgi:peptidoglycan/LPS O-acetylase OafA/YrhL